MGIILLSIFLIVYSLVTLFTIAIPAWVLGILALVTGIVLLAERAGFPRI
jgi:hypothetical protein